MGQPDLIKGTAWMAAGTVVGTAMVIIVRYASAEVHAFEIAFLRNAMAAAVLLPWFVIRHGGPPSRAGLGWHALRAVFTCGAMLAMFAAIPLLPVAEFTALTLTQPFLAAAGAAVFLGERVPPRLWGILLFGCAGGLLVAAPEFGAAFDAGRAAGVGLAVLGTLFAVGDYLVLRIVAQRMSSVTVVVWITLLLVPMTAGPAATVWTTPSAAALGWLAGLAAVASLGQYTATRAFHWSAVSSLMPVDLLRLVLAAGIGWMLFDEPLRPVALAGAAMIVLANLLALRRRV